MVIEVLGTIKYSYSTDIWLKAYESLSVISSISPIYTTFVNPLALIKANNLVKSIASSSDSSLL